MTRKEAVERVFLAFEEARNRAGWVEAARAVLTALGVSVAEQDEVVRELLAEEIDGRKLRC